MTELERIRENRLEGFECTINYYDDLCRNGHKLSSEQRLQLISVSNTVIVFGEYGKWLHDVAEEILEKS